ncbi:MAG: hypothetical protein GTO02_01370, partial [Candidatus Dadabacteria bacterium]|nr:hypothetical protein [Candidatus Dadabacteria bacterium]
MGLNPAPFDDIPFLRLPVMMKKKGERDSRYAYSKQKGMGVSLMYPSPVSQIKELRGLFEPNGTPMANQVSEKLLTFPT